MQQVWNHQRYVPGVLERRPPPVPHVADELVRAAHRDVDHVDRHHGRNLPRRDVVAPVTQIQNDDGGDDFGDGEEHVVLEVRVEGLVVVAEERPPAVVVRVHVDEVEREHRPPDRSSSEQRDEVLDALVAHQDEDDGQSPDFESLRCGVEINMLVRDGAWVFVTTWKLILKR